MILLLCLCLLVGCVPAQKEQKGKLKIVATLFPQYDFCRAIAGDEAEVTLLLPPGMESHTYEPSVSDMLAIHACDLFFYTGEAMEPWAETLKSSLPSSVRVADVSVGIELAEHEHEHHEHHDEEHEEKDPHIWTDPNNAGIMVKNICTALCEADPAHQTLYLERAARYRVELQALDQTFQEIVSRARTRVICHGGRFSMTYFARRYGLTFLPAFDSCDSQAEPSCARVTELIKAVREQNLPVVFYEELTVPHIARVIAEETGARMMLLHTCHNLSRAERENGETYLSLMKQNAENLRVALGVNEDVKG